jgi:hypothetical protein
LLHQEKSGNPDTQHRNHTSRSRIVGFQKRVGKAVSCCSTT